MSHANIHFCAVKVCQWIIVSTLADYLGKLSFNFCKIKYRSLYCHLARIYLQLCNKAHHATCIFLITKSASENAFVNGQLSGTCQNSAQHRSEKSELFFFFFGKLPVPELGKLLLCSLRSSGYACSWNVNVQFENNATIILIKNSVQGFLNDLFFLLHL
jgi:hypothetical protein